MADMFTMKEEINVLALGGGAFTRSSEVKPARTHSKRIRWPDENRRNRKEDGIKALFISFSIVAN